jgi:hypothetical protein
LSGRDKKTGHYLEGNRGGPGRKVGSRNKLHTDFIAAVQAKWDECGDEVLEIIRIENPLEFAKLVVSILPKHHHVVEEAPLVTIVELVDGVRSAPMIDVSPLSDPGNLLDDATEPPLPDELWQPETAPLPAAPPGPPPAPPPPPLRGLVS